MLNKKIEDALNQQVKMEGQASSIYLAMANWCDQEGLDGCAQFLYRQSDEERSHMLKIIHFLNEVEGQAHVPAFESPQIKWENVKQLFAMVYQEEQKVTQSIHNMVDLSLTLNDHRTRNFLQWYVEEQHEEETAVRNILDRIKLIGDGPQSLYYIDKELSKFNAAALAAEAANEEE